MDKPKIKDAVQFFKDEYNWDVIKGDQEVGMFLEKCKHLPVIRLLFRDHRYNEYVHYELEDLLYFYPAHDIYDIHNASSVVTDISQSEIQSLVRNHWEEE